VRDSNLRDRLGCAGWRTAQERFDRRRLAGQVIPLYERLAAAASN
jgi:hypothetical protein